MIDLVNQLNQFLRLQECDIGISTTSYDILGKVVLLLPFLNTAYLLSYMTMKTHLMKNFLLIMSFEQIFYSTIKN